MDVKLYVLDADGIEYRVHDARYGGGRAIRVPLGDPSARYRIFVPRDPEQLRRIYEFRREEPHGVTAAELDRQFSGSEYSPRRKPDTSDRRPW